MKHLSKFRIENFSDLLISRIKFLRAAREQAVEDENRELREQMREDWDDWRSLPADERFWLQEQLKGNGDGK